MPRKKASTSSTRKSCTQNKVAVVMREYHTGKLKLPSGKPVTSPEQAKAIAFSEARKHCNAKKKKK